MLPIWLALVMTGAASMKIERRVHLWVELSDTVIEEKEPLFIDVWMEISPGIGTVVPRLKSGKPMPIHATGNSSFLLEINTPTDGYWHYIVPGPNLCSTWPGVNNNSFYIGVFNWQTQLGCAEPQQKNPIDLLSCVWWPLSVLEPEEVEIRFPIASGGVFFKVGPPAPLYEHEGWYTTWTGATIWLVPKHPVCDPDCDLDGLLTIDDFVCFQTLFAVGDPKADCDADGVLNIDDFICFQTAFAIGC
jgi:hypothetical protein